MGSGSSRKTAPAARRDRAVGGPVSQPSGGANQQPASQDAAGRPPAATGGGAGAPPAGQRRNDDGYDRRRPAPANLPPYRDDPPNDDRGRPRRPTSAYRGTPPPGQGSSGMGQRSRTFDERNRLIAELEKIANDVRNNPPGRVFNSPSYDSSFEHYNQRVNSSSQEELDSWYEMELDTLKHRVVDDLLKAQYSMDDLNAVMDSAQLYEYRLELTALVHCFLREDDIWMRHSMELENQRQQDLEFLRSLQQRVEGGTRRPVVLGTMTDYAQRYGGDGGTGGTSSKGRNVYPAAGLRQTYHGEPAAPAPAAAARQGRPPMQGSQFSDEADRIMTDYERSRQRAVDARKQDRERIDRELDNYLRK